MPSQSAIRNTAYPWPSGWCWRSDEISVAGRLDAHGVLDEAGEAVADPLGGAAVEPEDVLVEVGGEVLLAHRAVVGAQEPALDEAEDEMDAGQPERGGAAGRAEIDGLVVVAPGRQAEVAAPAVGGHGRRPGDMGGEEGVQARGRGVGQRGEPEPAETAPAGLPAAGLDRPADRGLAGGAPAALAGPRAADVGLVGLDAPGQGVAGGGHPGPAGVLDPGPRGAGARGRGGPWPRGACAARTRRSGSCPSPAAARARWRRSRPCWRSPGRWPGTTWPSRSWSARRWCRPRASAACGRPRTRRRSWS